MLLPPDPTEFCAFPYGWETDNDLDQQSVSKQRRQDLTEEALARLARISHQLSAADADLLAVTRRTPSSRFDVVSATPSAYFGPCALSQRHLRALATKVGEIYGLDELELGLPVRRRSDFVKSAGTETQWDRSWHFFAYSYCQAFDSLWDTAYARRSGTLDYPLLFICRQSIELWLKAAISTVLQSDPPAGHELSVLWSELTAALTEHTGHSTDGPYPESIEGLIQVLDAHDRKGDRFRYPIERGKAAFSSTVADLEELYRVHELITGFCDAVHTQLEVERDLPH